MYISARVSDKQRKISEKSLANLRPFKKGRSGNLFGRPKNKTLSEALRALLEQPIGTGKNAKTTAEAIAIEILKKARGAPTKADVRAFEAIRDTVEGKPAQRIDMGGSLQITKERERQVRFLAHVIKETQQEVGGAVSVAKLWMVVEERERILGEDVSELRDAVLAALGVGDEKAI